MRKTLWSLSVLACLLLTGNIVQAMYIKGRFVDACNQGVKGTMIIDLPDNPSDGVAYSDVDGYWEYFVDYDDVGKTFVLKVGPYQSVTPYWTGDPNQVFNTSWVTITHPQSADFKVNGTQISSSPQNISIDVCDNTPGGIKLTNLVTTVGDPSTNSLLPNNYRVSVYATDHLGTPPAAGATPLGQTAIIATSTGMIEENLSNLIPSSYAGEHVFVKMETWNRCVPTTQPAKVATGRFKLLKLQAQARFNVVNSFGQFVTASQDASAPTLASKWSIGINPNISTGTIETYTLRVDAVYSNGRVINQYTPIVNTAPAPVPAGGFDYMNFNDHSNPNGAFSSVTCQKYKVTFTVYNTCGSDTYWAYVKIGSASCQEPIDTGIEPEPPCCGGSRMSVYPNPTTSTTTINYNLEKPSKVTLNVIDITGKAIITLVNNEEKNTGFHETTLDMSKLTKGIYIYKLITDSGITTGKILKN